MKLSVVIPAHNEEACIGGTVRALYAQLSAEQIEHEILVVNDNSSDLTWKILTSLRTEISTLSIVNNDPPHGFGFAVRKGLDSYDGDAVAIYMADASDRPEDLVRFWRVMENDDVDCVFGTRFSKRSQVVDYPFHKFILNRIANTFIQVIFALRYNDVTNAFKLYGRQVIDGVRPLLSHHFNLTVELPLKSIVRGYTYAIVPNDWINRKTGLSKLRVQEMGSRYLFIVLYCFIEKWLSRRDYHRERLLATSTTQGKIGEIRSHRFVADSRKSDRGSMTDAHRAESVNAKQK
jgi:dolichol-phosphate mannosyltransferase